MQTMTNYEFAVKHKVTKRQASKIRSGTISTMWAVPMTIEIAQAINEDLRRANPASFPRAIKAPSNSANVSTKGKTARRRRS